MGDDGHLTGPGGGVIGLRLGKGDDLHLTGIGQLFQEGDAPGEDFRLHGGHGEMGLLGGGHIHLAAPAADRPDGVHHQLHRLLLGGEVHVRGGCGPVLEHEEPSLLLPAAVRQGLPDLLGDEGHEGVEQLEHLGQDIAQHLLGPLLAVLVLPLEAGLGQLDIPVAVVVPDEVVDLLGGHPQLIPVHVLGDLPHGPVQPGQDPLVLQLQLLGQGTPVDGQVHHQEAAGVPQLVGEVAHGLAPLGEEAHIVARGVACNQVEAQGVGAVLLRDLQGVDAVAQGLAHLPPLVVPDQAVDEDGVEGGLSGVLTAGEDHSGHPEEDDVIAGHQHVGGVEVAKILRVVRPAQGGEGPQGGGEPGIQHVVLLLDVPAPAVAALVGVGLRDGELPARLAGPGGDAVAPPQLPGDAPVPDVLHPVEVGLGEAVGDEFGLPLPDHPEGLPGQRLHLDEPLGGDEGLHIAVTAGAGPHVVLVGLHLDQPAPRLQVGDDGFPGLIAVHAGVLAISLHDFAAVIQDPDGLQLLAQAHLKVVGVVGGGHLHAARPEAHVHVLVGHDGHLPAHQGEDAGFAHDIRIPPVLGVDRHAGVPQHGLRPGGGHDHIPVLLPLDGVADVPEVPRLVLILHLHVGQGSDAVGTPVDDAGPLVDQPLLVQGDEHVAHRPAQPLVHGEAGPLPVGGDAQLLLLLDDAGAVLGLPVPDPLQKPLPAQVVAAQALIFAQLLLHLHLGGDARVVRPGEVERRVPLHPLVPDEHVLEGVVHGVAHVELSRHVGRGHDNGEGLPFGVPVSPEAAVLLPALVNAGLHLLGLVDLGQFFSHVNSPFLS